MTEIMSDVMSEGQEGNRLGTVKGVDRTCLHKVSRQGPGPRAQGPGEWPLRVRWEGTQRTAAL